jgi:riboflavin synthase
MSAAASPRDMTEEAMLFTGIIEETGIIQELRTGNQGVVLTVGAAMILPTLKIGDSIAVNGVCLTIIRAGEESFACDLSMETLQRSSLKHARPRTFVNLERPMVLGGRLGGHLVQGHVDGIGELISAIPSGDGIDIKISYPTELERYLVYKGSIAVDGISLTIASLQAGSFSVAAIPHTFKATNLKYLRIGDPVNLEADILGKYFERFFGLGLIQGGEAAPGAASRLTADYLKEQGF